MISVWLTPDIQIVGTDDAKSIFKGRKLNVYFVILKF